MASRKALVSLVQNYFENDPLHAAHYLENLGEEAAVEILKVLPEKLLRETLSHLQDAFAARLVEKLPEDIMRKAMEYMDAQKAASIFRSLSAEARGRCLKKISDADKKKIQEFLIYPLGSAGELMSTDFLAFHLDTKIKDAIEKIRATAQKGYPASYVYVIDNAGKLAGVLNMRDMMLADGNARIESAMRREVYALDAFMDREQMASEFALKKFFAVPVVDSEKRLLGVIRAEQLIQEVQEEASEDIQKMFGAGGDERAFSPIRFSLMKRLPWLHVNLITAFLAAWVVSLFENIIAKITVLAVYLPIVAGQGGNAGAQSLAVVMRGIVLREIPKKKIKAMIFKESFIGIVNGIVIGAVTAAISWLWHGSPYLGLVIGLGMLVNLFLAGFSGAAIPLAMKAVGLDPAQCSNIILTTITDVMGFLSFLGFAVIFQKYLL